MAVVFLGFGVLVVLLLIQYRITLYRHKKKIGCEDKTTGIKTLAIIRENSIEHIINTCVNYVMFVWAVIFTKAFQGIHCISRERIVLAEDLGMEHWPIFWTSLILMAAVIAFPVITALINWRYRGGPRSSFFTRSLFVSTTDEFVGRTAWIANSLLVAVCPPFCISYSIMLISLGGYTSCFSLRNADV